MTSHNGAPDLGPVRKRMLELLRKHITDERVLRAMAEVPRERFVPPEMAHRSYDDSALPIGEGQTISQPLIVAMMLEALDLQPADRVLEIGTGSGYLAALLSRLVREVHTVERKEGLLLRAAAVLAESGYENVNLHAAGDVLGWPEAAPYDAIVVSASAPHVPRTLIDQLAEGGRLVIPIGTLRVQELVCARKTAFGIELVRLGPCGFVPLIGEDAWSESDHVASINVR